jgi:hypothetical protein
MRSSHILTLFSDRPEVSQRPSSFVVSILAHIAALALLTFGIVYTPEIHDRVTTERLSIRHLDLHAPEPKKHERAASKIAYPGPHPQVQTPSPGGSQPALPQIAQAEPGPQTLVQPDLPKHVKLKEKLPVPTVVIWSPKKKLAKALVAPLPEKPTAADVDPAADPPNEEVNLADLSVSSTNALAETHDIFPSTTSPLVIHGPDQVQLPPATASQTTAQPTPTAVMSLSDVQMREGTVNLPPVNETASATSPGALAQRPARNLGEGRQRQPGQHRIGSWKWAGCGQSRRPHPAGSKAAWREA